MWDKEIGEKRGLGTCWLKLYQKSGAENLHHFVRENCKKNQWGGTGNEEQHERSAENQWGGWGESNGWTKVQTGTSGVEK